MPAPASQTPTRLPAGASTDAPFQPLADSGYCNPCFYHQFYDDFDYSLGATGLYTVSKGSTGTATHVAGDGGLVNLSTAATNNDYVSIQLPAASFTLPQGALAGKKFFFLARFQLSDITASAFILGMTNVTATPFTAIADGVYFQKSSGGTVLNLISTVGSTPTTTAVPTSAYTLVNSTNLDIAFYIDRQGNLNGFCGSQLVGFIPQSGTGTGGSIGAGTPTRGRVMQVLTPTLTTANLTPTLAIQAGAVAVKTIVSDFWAIQKER